MRIALAQLNPIVGDIAGNAAVVIDAIERARQEGAELLVTSELAIIGYPPRDLLLREGVVEACEAAVGEIADVAGDMHVLVGFPRRTNDGLRGVRNSAALCMNGQIIAVADKQLLPGYDVFDEDRYFDPGPKPLTANINGQRVAVLLCEDLWRGDDVDATARYERQPLLDVASANCDVLVSLNASPFVAGKFERHLEQLREHAIWLKAPIVSVNQVGANDDLVFDGRSVVMGGRGEVLAVLPGFSSHVHVLDVGSQRPVDAPVKIDPLREVWDAIVLCVRDYFRKTGASTAIVGLSGGIDSALTAAVAAAALGPERVIGALMPSQYSSRGSIDDANALVEAIGLREPLEIPIHLAHEVLKSAVSGICGDISGSLADENTQARIRGLMLMAISNATAGSLLLSTSNKSEIAVGYSTLYGDMCGAIAPVGDLLKTRVYELSRWVNQHYRQADFDRPPIPVSSIDKPPSAELRPNQTDQDSLPPYEQLDAIVERYVEREQCVERIIAETGFDAALVEQVSRMIDGAQYKREQAAVIPKVTARAFGRGRAMPIVMKTAHLRARTPDSVEASAR